MSVLAVHPGYKPTQHARSYSPDGAWLRRHVVAAWLFWERGANYVMNVGGDRSAGTLVLGASGAWKDMEAGPGLACGATAYVDTNATSWGGVSLLAEAGQKWTVAVRSRLLFNAGGTPAARAVGTVGSRVFMIRFNGSGSRAATPTFDVRGTATTSSWDLDDGLWHTIYVTWDGTTAIAYYDSGRGALTLGVGAVTETTDRLMIGARTHGSPNGFTQGDIDFCAILNVALSRTEVVRWNRDVLAPWRPARRRILKASSPQLVYPGSDVTDGSWLNESSNNTNLYASVDESGAANDADYIRSSNNPSADAVELKFGAFSNPGTGAGKLVIRHRRL